MISSGNGWGISANRANQLISDIRRRREAEIERAPELFDIVKRVLATMGELYGEEVQYVLELVQNADDAGAASISFIFEDDRLLVVNDGVAFTETDVRDITTAGVSHKKNKTGFLGVGFKSVFKMTDRPHIVSGPFNFEIQNFIIPKERDDIPFDRSLHRSDKGSVFVLPYKDGVSADSLFNGMGVISDRLLLFLRNLTELSVVRSGEARKSWQIRRTEGESGELSIEDTRTKDETRWLVRSKELRAAKALLPDEKRDLKTTRVVVAFPTDSDRSSLRVQDEPLFCFLPTRQRPKLPFLIQADFLPAPGRSHIREHPWNDWLIGRLGALAAGAICELREDSRFKDRIFEFIPLAEEVDPSVRVLLEEMHQILKRKRIVPSADGGLVSPRSSAVGNQPDLVGILTPADLRITTGHGLSLMDPALGPRAEDVILELGGKPIGLADVVSFLGKGVRRLRIRGPIWFLQLYGYLAREFEPSRLERARHWSSENPELLDSLRRVRAAPILKLQDGGLATPERAMDRSLIGYPGRGATWKDISRVARYGNIALLHRDLQESSVLRRKGTDQELESLRHAAKQFLSSELGVERSITPYGVISKVIIPRLSRKAPGELSHSHHYDMLDYVRRKLGTYLGQLKRNRPAGSNEEAELRRLSSELTARCGEWDGSKIHIVYRPISHIHLTRVNSRRNILARLFKRVRGIPFLSDYYIRRESSLKRKESSAKARPSLSWPEFFLKVGAWTSPAVVPVERREIPEKEARDRGVYQYSTRGHFLESDWESPALEMLFEYSARLPTDARRERMELLWKMLSGNWSRYTKALRCSYSYHFHSWHEEQADTSFLRLLREKDWIPTVQGQFAKASGILLGTNENVWMLGPEADYVTPLPRRAFVEALGIKTEPSLDEVLESLGTLSKQKQGTLSSILQRCAAIYEFLSRRMAKEEEAAARLVESFLKEELVYIPRTVGQWWTADRVYLAGAEQVFERFRGSLTYAGEFLYPANLRPFFEAIGVRPSPQIGDYLAFLREMATANHTDQVPLGDARSLAPRVYKRIEMLLPSATKPDLEALETFSREGRLLSRSGEFQAPADLMFADSEMVEREFGRIDNLLDLSNPAEQIHQTLKVFGVTALSSSVTFSVHARGRRALDPDIEQRMNSILDAIIPFLEKDDPNAHEIAVGSGMLERLERISLVAVSSLSVTMRTTADGTSGSRVVRVNPEVYFHRQSSTIYIRGEDALRTRDAVAALAELVPTARSLLAMFATTLLDSIFDPEDFEARIRGYGLDEVDGPGKVEVVELLTSEETLGAVRREFEEAMRGRSYESPLPRGRGAFDYLRK